VGAFVSSIAGGIACAISCSARTMPRCSGSRHSPAAGVLQPQVERRIGLDEVAEAQRAMQRGHGRGKFVVLP